MFRLFKNILVASISFKFALMLCFRDLFELNNYNMFTSLSINQSSLPRYNTFFLQNSCDTIPSVIISLRVYGPIFIVVGSLSCFFSYFLFSNSKFYLLIILLDQWLSFSLVGAGDLRLKLINDYKPLLRLKEQRPLQAIKNG